MECICGKFFENLSSLKSHMAKCKIYQKELSKILTFEFLNREVSELGKSANSVAMSLNNSGNFNIFINANKIIRFCKKYGIKTFSIKESSNLKETRKKYKKTCIDRYGSENALSKNSAPYVKRNNTVLEKYGVKNVFQLHDTKSKSKKTLLLKYGVDNPSAIPGRYKNCGMKSKIHNDIYEMIKEIALEEDIQNEKTGNFFKKYNNFLKRDYSPRPDILIESKKIVIEINGDYWHANPKKYKESDIICRWTGETKAGYIWDFDKSRIEQIESFGYRVIILWEDDINKKKEEIKGELCKMLK